MASRVIKNLTTKAEQHQKTAINTLGLAKSKNVTTINYI